MPRPEPSDTPHRTPSGFLDSRRHLGIRPGLERVRALRALHANQHDPFAPSWRAIPIAGTKGKGSTAENIQRLLLQANFRVGAFFSPYVYDLREQIQIGGTPVSEPLFTATLTRLQEDATRLGATEFEVLTAVAFLLFDQQEVDYAVVEVGVGGREDATNILSNPAVTVLTPIGLDHQDLLGPTISSIAEHKAGILRPGVPAVVNVPNLEAHAVIDEQMSGLGVDAWEVRWRAEEEMRFSVETPLGLRSGLHPGMPGTFQRENAATAVTVLDLLTVKAGLSPLSDAAVQAGLSAASLPGRYQILQKSPVRVIADGAHNALSALVLAEALSQEPYHRLFLVVGMKQNHDVETFLPPLGRLMPAGLVATAPTGPNRGVVHPPERIAQAAALSGIPVLGVAGDARQAVKQAFSHMQPGDLLCICGSFVLIGDMGGPEAIATLCRAAG